MQPPRNAVEAASHADPWPYYRGLREMRPLFFDAGLGLWVASGHAVIAQAFAHPALCVRPPGEAVPRVLAHTAAGEVFGQLVRMNDGEFHATHRAGVDETARRWTRADAARAGEAAARSLRTHVPANEFVAMHAVQAMARLLEVPDDRLDETCRWVQQFTEGIAPGASAASVALASGAARALMAQGRALGLSSVRAANRIAFMQQALDGTAGLLGHAVLALERLSIEAAAADLSLDAMRGFVAEVERYCAPIQNTRRFAAQPLLLAGQAIDAGQGVLLVLASANRDECLNPEPDRFDPRRAVRRSMGFGHGAHACPGSAIAIEIVAACARWMRATGLFDQYFKCAGGFKPLPNARIPVFQS